MVEQGVCWMDQPVAVEPETKLLPFKKIYQYKIFSRKQNQNNSNTFVRNTDKFTIVML